MDIEKSIPTQYNLPNNTMKYNRIITPSLMDTHKSQ